MSANTHKTYVIQIAPEHTGLRLDKLLATFSFVGSRSRAAQLIERGWVTLKGRALRASTKLTVGAEIEIQVPAPEPSELVPLEAPLDLLFEDEDLVVLNKPAGLVVHPAAGHAQDTLVNILLFHVDQLAMGFGERRPGIVHRLDRDTSGVLVVAKNDFAHQHLSEQFRLRTVHRIYWALVFGKSPVKERTLKSFLSRHPQNRKRFASSREGLGKSAITHYKVLQERDASLSWLQCKLETGRTHQIRVHLSEAGLPILGDSLYGADRSLSKIGIQYREQIEKLNRVALHACELGFDHPRSRERMLFRVPWPDELRALAKDLGFESI